MKETNQLQIKTLLENYCSKCLNSELSVYVLRLFDTITINPLMDITRGRTEIWAASIVYVIARLNFLLDKDSDNYISFDELCSYFNTKKSTIGNKATQIEINYDIVFCDENYTIPEISDSFGMSIEQEGFIIPKFIIGILSKEELKRFEEEKKLAIVQERKKRGYR